MLKQILLHRYTHMALVAVAAVVAYRLGYHTEALIAGSLAEAFIIARGTYRAHILSVAFEAGVFVGIASLFSWWSLIAFPVLLLYLYGPMRVVSPRMFWACSLGLVTPLWCYSPYWLFHNTDYLTSLLFQAKDSLL